MIINMQKDELRVSYVRVLYRVVYSHMLNHLGCIFGHAEWNF